MSDYKIDPYTREMLKYYHGPEPFDPNDYNTHWTPKFSRYHRDNLVSLFNVIGYGAKAIHPFHLFNTGDWVGEIPQMLSIPVIVDGSLRVSYVIDEERDRPNQTREAVERNLVAWLRGRLHSVDENTPGEYCPFGSNCHIIQAKKLLEL